MSLLFTWDTPIAILKIYGSTLVNNCPKLPGLIIRMTIKFYLIDWRVVQGKNATTT